MDPQPRCRPPAGRGRPPAAAAAQRCPGHRRAALGAPVRRPRQQLHRAVRAHPAGALPRHPAGPACDGRRRPVARAGRHLLADRPRRARRRGRVEADLRGPRPPGRGRPRRGGPPAPADDGRSCIVAAQQPDPRHPLRRPRRVRRTARRGRHLLPGPLRPQGTGDLVDPGPAGQGPRPAADGRAQRLPVGPDRRRRSVRRDGPGPGPAGRDRGRRHAVPHQRPGRGLLHGRLLRRRRRRAAGGPGRDLRPQDAARRVRRRVGHPRAVPPRSQRQHLRQRVRPARHDHAYAASASTAAAPLVDPAPLVEAARPVGRRGARRRRRGGGGDRGGRPARRRRRRGAGQRRGPAGLGPADEHPAPDGRGSRPGLPARLAGRHRGRVPQPTALHW